MIRLTQRRCSLNFCIQIAAFLAHIVVPAFAFSPRLLNQCSDLRGTLTKAKLLYDSVNTYDAGDLMNNPMSLAKANGNIFVLNSLSGVTLVRFAANSTPASDGSIRIVQFTEGKSASSLLPQYAKSSISSLQDMTGTDRNLYLLPRFTASQTLQNFPIPNISLQTGEIPLPCPKAPGDSSCRTPAAGSLLDISNVMWLNLNSSSFGVNEKCDGEGGVAAGFAHPVDLTVDPNSGTLFLLNMEPQNKINMCPKQGTTLFPTIAEISASSEYNEYKLVPFVQAVENCSPEVQGKPAQGKCNARQRYAWYTGGNANPKAIIAASNGFIYVLQDCTQCALMRSDENNEDIPLLKVNITTGITYPVITAGVQHLSNPTAVTYDPDTENVYIVQANPPEPRSYVVQVTKDGVATPFLEEDTLASAPSDIVSTESGLFIVSSDGTISFVKPCCGSDCSSSALSTGQLAGIVVGGLCAFGIFGWLFCSYKGKRRRGQRAKHHLSEPLLTPQLNSFLTDASAAHKWTIDFDDLTLERVVGTGSWGRVYSGQFHGSRVAIKELMGFRDENGEVARDEKAERALEDFKKECLILMGLHHAAVIEFFGLSEAATGMLYIVTEYCDTDIGKLLQTGLREKKYVGFHDRLTWHDICNQLCSGMRYLHAQGIIHRDLKPDNVLLTRGAPWSASSEGASTKRGSRRSRLTINGLRPVTDERFVAKICDFGISKQMDHSAKNPLSATHTRAAGTPLYMSPEVMIGEQKEAHYSYKADVYSFAVVLWTMWCGDEPFRDVQGNLLALMMAITRGRRPTLDPKFQWPPNVVALLERCWTHNPDERPSFDELQSQGMLSSEILFPSKASARASVPTDGVGSIQGGAVGGLSRAHKGNFDLNKYSDADNAQQYA